MNERISFPVSTDTLWDILQNKKAFNDRYLVDAKTSIQNFSKDDVSLGCRKIANYINNLGIRVRLDTSSLSFTEKAELFFDWLYGSNVCEVRELTETIIHLVFTFKGFKVETESIFSDEEAVEFIKHYGAYVERWVVFYDSLLVYALKHYHGHHVIADDPSKEFMVIDEPDYTPLNLVTVFGYADFTSYYSLLDGEHFAYLRREFDTPYFAGKQLYDYFYNKANPLAAFLAVTLVDSETKLSEEQ